MGDYIKELRKLVGHKTIIQTAASVIVENSKGQILLGRRTDNKMWGYAGGSVEIDEKVEDCALRELFEETGIVGEHLDFFMISSGKDVHYIYPNGDEVSNIEIIYTCNKYHGDLKPQLDEISELKFFDLDNLPKEISPPLRPVLSKYLQLRKQ